MKLILNNINNLPTDTCGELLRTLTFTEKGLGCYSNFELREDFKAILVPESILSYKLDPINLGIFDDEDTISAFSNGQWDVFWSWDGDGTLVFKVDNTLYVNYDCKKTHDWRKIFLT